jgi:prevent-host-death family protein
MSKSARIIPTIIPSTTLQRDFGAIIRRVHNNNERFIIERNGFSMMVILPVSDYEALSQHETEQEHS